MGTPDLSLSCPRATATGEGMADSRSYLVSTTLSLKGKDCRNENKQTQLGHCCDQGSFNPKKRPPGFHKLAEDHQKDLHLLPQPEGWACLGLLCSRSLARWGRNISAMLSQGRRLQVQVVEQVMSTSCASPHLFHIQVLFYGCE